MTNHWFRYWNYCWGLTDLSDAGTFIQYYSTGSGLLTICIINSYSHIWCAVNKWTRKEWIQSKEEVERKNWSVFVWFSGFSFLNPKAAAFFFFFLPLRSSKMWLTQVVNIRASCYSHNLINTTLPTLLHNTENTGYVLPLLTSIPTEN